MLITDCSKKLDNKTSHLGPMYQLRLTLIRGLSKLSGKNFGKMPWQNANYYILI